MYCVISRRAIKAILLVSALHLFGCSKTTEFNGFNPGLDILAKLEKGITQKSTVKALLGDPPVVQGGSGNTWIYFSQEIEKLAFLEPKVVSRSVTLLIFSSNKKLKTIESYTIKDSRIIDINTNKVISGGRKLTTLQQIFGNIGNFSAQNMVSN
tara:strand:- start:107 stop:568 length:462 start_codon:yes stop_codon:yes gene_type:complete